MAEKKTKKQTTKKQKTNNQIKRETDPKKTQAKLIPID